MNRRDCKIGMKVCLNEDLAKGRLKVKRIGEVVGVYERYAVVRILNKYNSGFFYSELTEYNDSMKDFLEK